MLVCLDQLPVEVTVPGNQPRSQGLSSSRPLEVYWDTGGGKRRAPGNEVAWQPDQGYHWWTNHSTEGDVNHNDPQRTSWSSPLNSDRISCIKKLHGFCLNKTHISGPIAMFRFTSPIDINVPTRVLLAVGTKSSFVLMVGTFEQQKECL